VPDSKTDEGGTNGLSRYKTHKKLKLVAVAIIVLASLSYVGDFGGLLGNNLSPVNVCAGTPQPSVSHSSAKRAALVDGLSSIYPHPQFVREIKTIMNKTGYSFDYFSEGAATLDFFFDLPNQGYSIIILRVEGVNIRVGDASPVAFATSDQYAGSQRISDQMRNDLGVIQANGHTYFAMTPKAISELMCGQFPGTTVLVMSCNSLSDSSLAQAFIDKGAKSFVGWNGSITIVHDDRVFTAVTALLTMGVQAGSAARYASNLFGADPIWGGLLSTYD